MKTFRSPWGVYAALVQVVAGGLFALIPFASEAGPLSKAVFGLLGLTLMIGALRASLMRVVQEGSQLTVHGFLGIRRIEMAGARPEIIDDKVVAAVWAPLISTTGTDQEVMSLLSGYGRHGRANRRVTRICGQMNQLARSTDAAGTGSDA